MEKNRRVQRVEKELREIISSYLTKQQAGSSDNLICVNNVVVSADLRHAKAFVCAIGKDEVDAETLADIQSHAAEIQRISGQQLRMKYCPKIRFYNDDSVKLFAEFDAKNAGGTD